MSEQLKETAKRLNSRTPPYDTIDELKTMPGHADPEAMITIRHKSMAFSKPREQHIKGGPFVPGTRVRFPQRYSGFTVHPAGTLEALHASLTALASDPHSMVIRPAITADADSSRVTRIADRKGRTDKHGHRPRNLAEAPRIWAMFDIDGLDGFDAPEDWLSDPEALVREVVKRTLPRRFRKAGVVAQFSSSMLPTGGTIKVHLWFILSRSLLTCELKHLVWDQERTRKGQKQIFDDKLFTVGQPHLTASPDIIDCNGKILDDWLGDARVLKLDGPAVEVPAGQIGRKQVQQNLDRYRTKDQCKATRGPAWHFDQIDGTNLHDSILHWVFSELNYRTLPESEAGEELLYRDLQAKLYRYKSDLGRDVDVVENRFGDDLKHSIDGALAILRAEEKSRQIPSDVLEQLAAKTNLSAKDEASDEIETGLDLFIASRKGASQRSCGG